MADFIERFEPLARDYDVLLCDVWGVMHNGLAAFPAACEALMRFRAGGGTAILITNAPRSGEAVARILDRLKIPREAYDAITSSGDVTRAIVKGRLPESVFHLGPERDLSIFAGLDVRLAPAETADYVVCSGLFDDTIETPVEPGRHTLQVRNGRNSSRTQTFDAAEGEIVAFRCTGKRFLPLFLASFVVPRLALSLRPA